MAKYKIIKQRTGFGNESNYIVGQFEGNTLLGTTNKRYSTLKGAEKALKKHN